MKIQPKQFGKYVLLDRIGVGGMAEIWRARQFGAAGFQKELVIKKILQHLADNDEFIRMFIDEAKIAVSLQHANVIQVFDLGAVDREYFIAMEYVAGKDLLNLLIRCTHLRIRVPQKLAIHITAEVLKGLQAAHTAVDSQGTPLNIIHRDVSPSNVLVSYEGEVKIGDFGVAKARRREAITRSGTLKGKLGYMSPEQVNGQPVDHRADLFSAGILLYEMLAMNRLFHGKTELETLMLVRECNVGPQIEGLPGLPEALKAILRRALARAPEERFQTVDEFQDALLDHLFAEKTRVTPGSMGQFMKSVFAKEIEEELSRQKEIEQLLAEAGPLHVDPTPPRALRPATERLVTTREPKVNIRTESRFRIRDREGVVYGPMGLNTLVDIIRRDGLEGAEEVSVDGEPWLPARDLPVLTESALPPAEAPRPDFSGRFERHEFTRLLYRYAVCKATGRMHLETGSKRKEIYWRRGRPEYVTSNLRSELLGEYLVERRLITRAKLNEALAALSEFGGRLGDALIHLDILSAHDLFNALSAQVKAKLLEVFSWHQGSYSFFSGEYANAQIVPLELGAFPLINEGVCRRLALDDLKGHFDGRESLPFVRLEHKLLSPPQLQLSARQQRVWNAVSDGVPIAGQLGRLMAIPGVSEADIYQVLFLMERLDFATFEPPLG